MEFSRKLLADLSVSALLLYAGICLYEGTNFVVLSALGAQASLVVWGVLPIGVSASVPGSALLPLAKPVQVAASCLLMFALFRALRSRRLTVSSTVSLTTISVYLASAYWEMLPALSSLSYEVHLVVFCLLAIGGQVALSTAFRA